MVVRRNNIFNSSIIVVVSLFLYFDESEGRKKKEGASCFLVYAIPMHIGVLLCSCLCVG